MSNRKPHLDLEATHYDPSVVEEGISELWDDHKVHVAEAKSEKPAYSIVIPPPNVTGRLHMGHALNNTLQDVLIRYKRMDGYNALWVPGTDHAGIATQSVVKKQLDAEGIDWKELGREKMVERIWEWKEKYGDHILHQLRRLGCSCDWTRTRFTMDDGLSAAVRTAFKRLYDQGLIYRGKYIVNWCPVDRTALSDDEVETKDGGEPGHLWHFKYPLKDSDEFVTIATTRPETMLGDSAIAVNPADERYKSLVGKLAILPLVGREIPIIADDYVDAEFGTGCVKITPAHDPNDFQIGLRHELEQITIMHEDATINENAPEQFQGMDRFTCRTAVVDAMQEQGLLVKVEDRNTPVGRSYRSKAIIEYRLSDQWFVKMRPLADKALEASESGRLAFYPQRWDGFYRDWLGKIRDWCISRQLWWGHRIPAWYNKETGEVLVEVETPQAVLDNPGAWEQDEDVLDTWFSSALWPYSTLGWPEATDELNTFYPTDVLVTAKDIIFFWVARMVMTGLNNMEEMPFHEVLINSIICDEDGETMSKSKGNGIDPLHVIQGATLEELSTPVYEARPANLEKIVKRIKKRFPEGFKGVGADSLRYTMLTGATDAQQVQLSLKKFDEVGRPFSDKLWNASRLTLGLLGEVGGVEGDIAEPALEDSWIVGRLDKLVADVRSGIDKYSLHRSTDALYRFFWDDLCDWYLEIAKHRLREGDEAQKLRVAATLTECFTTVLRALHPIMPFITEELWGHFQPLALKQGLIPSDAVLEEVCALASYPKDQGRFSEQVDAQFEIIREVVRAVRNMRAHAGLSPKLDLECAIVPGTQELQAGIASNSALISKVAGLKELKVLEAGAKVPEKFAVSVLEGVQVCLNLIEHMDIDAEIARTQKSLEKVEGEISKIEAKLSNEKFVSKAPENVVQAEKDRLSEASSRREQVIAAISELESMR